MARRDPHPAQTKRLAALADERIIYTPADCASEAVRAEFQLFLTGKLPNRILQEFFVARSSIAPWSLYHYTHKRDEILFELTAVAESPRQHLVYTDGITSDELYVEVRQLIAGHTRQQAKADQRAARQQAHAQTRAERKLVKAKTDARRAQRFERYYETQAASSDPFDLF